MPSPASSHSQENLDSALSSETGGDMGGLRGVGFENLGVLLQSVICRDSWNFCHLCAEGKGPGTEIFGSVFLPKNCKTGWFSGGMNGEVRAK